MSLLAEELKKRKKAWRRPAPRYTHDVLDGIDSRVRNRLCYCQKLMDDETHRNSQRMGLHRLAWAAGIIGLPLSHYWLAAKIEPFYSSIYCFLWWPYIFAADFAVYKLRATSLLRDRPKEF